MLRAAQHKGRPATDVKCNSHDSKLAAFSSTESEDNNLITIQPQFLNKIHIFTVHYLYVQTFIHIYITWCNQNCANDKIISTVFEGKVKQCKTAAQRRTLPHLSCDAYYKT